MAVQLSPGPLVHKVAMMAICERMYDWHVTTWVEKSVH